MYIDKVIKFRLLMFTQWYELKLAKIHCLDLVLLNTETQTDKCACRFLKLKEVKARFQDSKRYHDMSFFDIR